LAIGVTRFVAPGPLRAGVVEQALTDVAGDLWIDGFSAGNDSLRLATPHDWSVRKRTLRGGPRDGVDVIEVHNGALYFSVLPTRGMGLWRGEYRGNFLGWRSQLWLAFVRRRMARLAARVSVASIRTWPAAAWQAAGRDRATRPRPGAAP